MNIAAIRFLDDGISTEGSMKDGNNYPAEKRRILERTNKGRIGTKSKGVQFGRKPKIDKDKLYALHADGITGVKLAKQMGISRATLYKILKDKIKARIKDI